ncbi:MAG: hypothetical protein FD138_1689 [Planctomycetota bacterium]|nr:MAG: hypothetical protein FD138_1689 [Planctomycetota bacterium]
MKISVWTFVALAILCVGGYFGYLLMTQHSARQAMQRAESAVRHRNWTSVRIELSKYLDVFPQDDAARLHLAEAYFKDATMNPERAVSLAIEQMRFIPHTSPHWPAACVQEARMHLFARLQPHRAELLLREMLATDPDNVDGNYVLWKLYDLTGRSHLAEPNFRRVLAATPAAQRPLRLREWYLSQFYPATANPELDQLMGFYDPSEKRSAVTELRRLEAFREREPTSALNHAAVARWYSLEGDPKTSLKLLQQALDETDAPLQDPFFVATLIQVLFDLGEFDNAMKYFRAWPGERSGYEYVRLSAILADEVERDYERAIRHYQQVISVWPGQADWRIQYRLARCLIKNGDDSSAESTRQKAKKIELLMEEDVHAPLRRLLATPDQLEICGQMTQFYEQLGLEFEANQWRDLTHVE